MNNFSIFILIYAIVHLSWRLCPHSTCVCDMTNCPGFCLECSCRTKQDSLERHWHEPVWWSSASDKWHQVRYKSVVVWKGPFLPWEIYVQRSKREKILLQISCLHQMRPWCTVSHLGGIREDSAWKPWWFHQRLTDSFSWAAGSWCGRTLLF